MFETFVVGSLPRPQWVRDLIEDLKAGRVAAAEAGRLLDDVIPLAIRMQERAGLDYVSDGEWRRESYVKVFADAVDGFENDLIVLPTTEFSGLTYPAVVSKLVPRRAVASGEAAFLLDHTDRKTIAAVPSPYTVGRRMWAREYSTAAYPTREEFMDACIPIIRKEILGLAGLGVDAVQLDDPWLALLVDPSYRESEGVTDVDRGDRAIGQVRQRSDGGHRGRTRQRPYVSRSLQPAARDQGPVRLDHGRSGTDERRSLRDGAGHARCRRSRRAERLPA